jgi:hypothetical protein
MQPTLDNGFIIAGMTRSFGSGNADMYLVKTDNSGNLLWTHTFGHTGNEYAYSVDETTDGGFIITGKASVGAGGTDMMLVRTDPAGNIIWAKAYGTTANEDGYSVEQTPDGGYIVAGSTGITSGYYDMLLVKTDSSGNLQWAKTYTNLLHDYGKSVRQTNDGGYIIAGYTDNTGITSADGYLVKTDSNGGLLWSKTYGMSSWEELIYCVQQTSDGGYVLSGYTNTTSNGHDVYIVKTDSQGTSGCNEAAGSTTVNTPVLQVTIDILAVSSGGVMAVSTPLLSGEGTFATICLVTGSDERAQNENQISVYPNPSPGMVTILFNDYVPEAGDKLLITNPLGQTVNVFELEAGQRKLELNLEGDHVKRIYFVTVIKKSGILRGKIISIH